jgi:hypothetical protein
MTYFLSLDRRGAYRVWWGDLRQIAHLENLGVNGRIISKLILKKWHGESWTGLIWLRIWTGRGLL